MKKENIVDGNIILAKMQNEAGKDLSGSFTVTLETVRSWVKEAEVKAEYAPVKDVRPIDAKPLETIISELTDAEYIYNSSKETTEVVDNFVSDILNAIDEQPTLDYAPVVHAKWELTTIFPSGIREYKCSKCGRKLSFFPADGTFHTIKEKLREYPYCNCGAKMDLGDDEK